MDNETFTSQSQPDSASVDVEPVKPVHVGVHITRADVSLVSIEGTKREWAIGRFASLPLPRRTIVGDEVENPDILSNTLLALWQLAGVNQEVDSVRVAIDGPQVTFTRRPEEKEVLVRVSAGLTRGVIQQLGKATPGQVVMTAPETFTASVREVTQNWPTRPMVVPSGFAAVRALGPNEEGGPRMLIIMDGERNTVILEREGKVALIRTYDGVGKGPVIDSWLRKGVLPSVSDIGHVASQAIEAAYGPAMAAEDELSVINLAGPAAQLPGLAEAVEGRLNVTARFPDPISSRVQETALLPSQQKEVSSRLVVSAGAALLGASNSKADLP